MASRWTVALVGLMVAGAFVWWFAPLGLYDCETVSGVEECYLAEDAFEVTIARSASAAGAVVALVAGLALLAVWIARIRQRQSSE